jgi:hypothetical protein
MKKTQLFDRNTALQSGLSFFFSFGVTSKRRSGAMSGWGGRQERILYTNVAPAPRATPNSLQCGLVVEVALIGQHVLVDLDHCGTNNNNNNKSSSLAHTRARPKEGSGRFFGRSGT